MGRVEPVGYDLRGNSCDADAGYYTALAFIGQSDRGDRLRCAGGGVNANGTGTAKDVSRKVSKSESRKVKKGLLFFRTYRLSDFWTQK